VQLLIVVVPDSVLLGWFVLVRRVLAGCAGARPDDVARARAVLFAITQPIELSISEITVQPARRPVIPA
jgi:hypothetical protein